MRNSVPTIETYNILSRRDYQEILLARMAGGDLYAHEELIRIRKVDKSLDKLRVACGAKPIYGEK